MLLSLRAVTRIVSHSSSAARLASFSTAATANV
jgi:hypothetical protein